MCVCVCVCVCVCLQFIRYPLYPTDKKPLLPLPVSDIAPLPALPAQLQTSVDHRGDMNETNAYIRVLNKRRELNIRRDEHRHKRKINLTISDEQHCQYPREDRTDSIPDDVGLYIGVLHRF